MSLFVSQFSHLHNGIIKYVLHGVLVRITVVRLLIVNAGKRERPRQRGSSSWKSPGSRELRTARLLSEIEGRVHVQLMLSRTKASVTPSLRKGQEEPTTIFCLTLTTCTGLPCTFWPSHHWETLAKQQCQLLEWERATPADIPPKGTQGQILKELQGGGGRKERHIAKHCPGHCSARTREYTACPSGPQAG